MYNERYDDLELRTDYSRRPWDLNREIITRSGGWLLDVGCGTAIKLLELAPHFKKITGIEPNLRMRARAEDRIKDFQNIEILEGEADNIPFSDNTFDVVSVMLAPHNTREIFRVLKPGGWVIAEKVGQYDKENIRKSFGSDTAGWRGRHLELGEGELFRTYKNDFEQSFGSVVTREGIWDCYLSMDGVITLLQQTPSVRNFDIEKDKHILELIEKNFGSKQGIATKEHRYLFCAKKVG